MKKSKFIKTLGTIMTAAVILAMMPITASAHCDTMEGPTAADGIRAMETNNVNYVLKWVQPEYEKEITDKFNLSMKVKDLSPEARELSEQYFLSEVVRVHRAGEGAPFDGLKPVGTPVDEKVLAADKSIAVGNLSPLEGLIEEEKMAELTERFERVMSLKDFDVNDLEAGREYIEAYVMFFKFAEGEEDHAGHGTADAHGNEAAHEGESAHDVEPAHDSDDVHLEESAHEEAAAVSQVTYTVKAGDTLYRIALRHHTTYPEIQKANKIANPHLIFPGQVFVIPVK